MEERGVDPRHIWEGSVASPESFQIQGGPDRFDAAICVGVLPHIPEELDLKVIENLQNAVKKGGLVVIEARNQLFSLFTLNRYSHEFIVEGLIRFSDLKKTAADDEEAKLSGARPGVPRILGRLLRALLACASSHGTYRYLR